MEITYLAAYGGLIVVSAVILVKLAGFNFSNIRLPDLSLGRKKKRVIGRADLPESILKEEIFDDYGKEVERRRKAEEKIKDLKSKLESEVKVNVSKDIKNRQHKEKLDIVRNGLHLMPYGVRENKKLKVIGEDGVIGNLISIIQHPNPNSVYVYYEIKNGEQGKERHLLGSKKFNQIIKKVDLDEDAIFVRYTKDGKFVPEKLVNI